MSLNRRTLLLGLVVLVVGAGVIGASGAFTSVEAERTMDLETTGDSDALLALIGYDNAITSTDQDDQTGAATVDTLSISNQSINANAKTTFEDAFRIQNNGEDDVQVYIEENTTNADLSDGGALDITVADTSGSASPGDSIVGTSASDGAEIGASGGYVNVTVVIDTTGDNTANDLPDGGTVTIVAEET